MGIVVRVHGAISPIMSRVSSRSGFSLNTEGDQDKELRLQSELNESRLELAELQEQHLRLIERATQAKR